MTHKQTFPEKLKYSNELKSQSKQLDDLCKQLERKDNVVKVQATWFGSYFAGRIIWAIAILFIAISIQKYIKPQETKGIYHRESDMKRGLAFVSSAEGGGKDIALGLADKGFHVILGVHSDYEMKYFKFIANKGIQTILFDITEPSHIADMTYKIDSITKVLGRKLTSVVLISHNYIPADSSLDIGAIHNSYQHDILGPLRVVQSLSPYFQTQDSRIVFVSPGAFELSEDSTFNNRWNLCNANCMMEKTGQKLVAAFAREFSITGHNMHKQGSLLTSSPSLSVHIVEYTSTFQNRDDKRKPSRNGQKKEKRVKDGDRRFEHKVYADDIALYPNISRAIAHALLSTSPLETYSIGSVIMDFTPFQYVAAAVGPYLYPWQVFGYLPDSPGMLDLEESDKRNQQAKSGYSEDDWNTVFASTWSVMIEVDLRMVNMLYRYIPSLLKLPFVNIRYK